jgi:hypothetical protein
MLYDTDCLLSASSAAYYVMCYNDIRCKEKMVVLMEQQARSRIGGNEPTLSRKVSWKVIPTGLIVSGSRVIRKLEGAKPTFRS